MVAAVGQVTVGFAVHRGRGPWFELSIAVFGPLLVWKTYRKFASDEPVDDSWDPHIRSFLLGAAATLGGVGAALTGGDDATAVNRLGS